MSRKAMIPERAIRPVKPPAASAPFHSAPTGDWASPSGSHGSSRMLRWQMRTNPVGNEKYYIIGYGHDDERLAILPGYTTLERQQGRAQAWVNHDEQCAYVWIMAAKEDVPPWEPQEPIEKVTASE